MNQSIRCLCLGISLVTAAAFVSAKTSFTLEAATFKERQAAEARLLELRNQGFSAVLVDYLPDQPGDYNYRVLIGNFNNAKEANSRKKELQQAGVRTAVRGKWLYKPDRIDAAIAGKLQKLFHLKKGKPVAAELTTAPLTGIYKTMHDQAVVAGETTAPETIAAYREMVEAMPDDYPLKGREVITLASKLFSGHSAYDRDRPDYTEIKKLLMKVANKSTSATTAQRRRARDLVIHITHYYDHNYVDAIRGYKQRIEAEKSTHPASTAIARASLAGAIFEVSKTGGYSTTKTQEALYAQWKENVAVQDTALTSDTVQAKDIRKSTGRIGLMLSESYIEQQMWSETEDVAANLVASYADYQECWPILAEAYCHVAHAACELGEKELCFSSADSAIEISKKIGKVWGDQNRDTLFKAYAWKNVSAYKFNEPEEAKNRIKADMIRLFPGHPGLKVYFGKEVEK